MFPTGGSESESAATSARHRRLARHLRRLGSQEVALDTAIGAATHHLRRLSQDRRYAYITYQDLKGIQLFLDQTVIPIRAPPETTLNVSIFGLT